MKAKTEIKAPKKPRRVFVVDRFPIVRMAVTEWLKQTTDLIVCGEADSPASALQAIPDLKPDIVVTEILRAQDLGFIQNLHQQHPGLPILVFSFRDEGWYAPLALAAGAHGYLMKGASIAGLVEGIRQALAGRRVVSPAMRAKLLSKCARRGYIGLPARKRRCQHGPPFHRNRG